MNINMFPIVMFIINLKFSRLFGTIFRHLFTGQLMMNRVRKEIEGVLRRAMNNNSQGIHQIKSIVAHQSPFLNNTDLMKGKI